MKKTFVLALSLLTSLAICGCSHNDTTEYENNENRAASTADNNDKWKKVYLQFLEDGIVNGGADPNFAHIQDWYAGIELNKCEYALVEVNDDEIPELMMYHHDVTYALVQYYQNKVLPFAFMINRNDNDAYYVGDKRVSSLWDSAEHYSAENIADVIREYKS